MFMKHESDDGKEELKMLIKTNCSTVTTFETLFKLEASICYSDLLRGISELFGMSPKVIVTLIIF